jgi:hypothetical protein
MARVAATMVVLLKEREREAQVEKRKKEQVLAHDERRTSHPHRLMLLERLRTDGLAKNSGTDTADSTGPFGDFIGIVMVLTWCDDLLMLLL